MPPTKPQIRPEFDGQTRLNALSLIAALVGDHDRTLGMGANKLTPEVLPQFHSVRLDNTGCRFALR